MKMEQEELLRMAARKNEEVPRRLFARPSEILLIAIYCAMIVACAVAVVFLMSCREAQKDAERELERIHTMRSIIEQTSSIRRGSAGYGLARVCNVLCLAAIDGEIRGEM